MAAAGAGVADAGAGVAEAVGAGVAAADGAGFASTTAADVLVAVSNLRALGPSGRFSAPLSAKGLAWERGGFAAEPKNPPNGCGVPPTDR